MKSSRNNYKQTLTAYSFLLPTLVVLGLFQFYPMVHALFLSMWDYFPMSPNNEFIGFDNFTRLFSDDLFWEALKNSILYLLVVPVIIATSLGLAMLVEPNLPGIGFFRACYYVPVVTMMVVVAFIWKVLFNTDNGVINQALIGTGVISDGIPWLTSEKMALWSIMTVTMWKGLGYYMVMFIVGLKAIPPTLVEAARIDGARKFQIFMNVTVPCLWPTISLIAILSSIAALQVFDEIYVLTSGRIGTATLVYMIYEEGFSGMDSDMGYASAVGVVLFLLLFVFTALSIKTMEKAYTD